MMTESISQHASDDIEAIVKNSLLDDNRDFDKELKLYKYCAICTLSFFITCIIAIIIIHYVL